MKRDEVEHDVTVEEAEEVIEKMYMGAAIARSLDNDTKRIRKFYNLIAGNPVLEKQYMQAQQASSEIRVAEIVEIADTEPDPNRARVMIDARKWYASKMKPDKYGDRIELNVNQMIDISAAIQAAKDRTILSTCYPIKEIDTQTVDSLEQLGSQETGYKPVISPNDNSSDDIFS